MKLNNFLIILGIISVACFDCFGQEQQKEVFVPIDRAYNRTQSKVADDTGQKSQTQPAVQTSYAEADESQTSIEKPSDSKEDAGKTEISSADKGLTQEVSAGSPPFLEIKSIEKEGQDTHYSVELRNVALTDLFRVLAHDYNLNILVAQDVTGSVSASFTNISLGEALQRIAESQNLAVEKKGNVIVIKPNLIPKVYVLRYIEAKTFFAQSAGVDSQPAIFKLLSKDGQIFLGAQPNSIMVIDYPDNLKKIDAYLQMADKDINTKIFRLKYISAREIVGTTVPAPQ